MERALLIGDSLAVPRPKRGQPLVTTWPALLKERFPGIDIWQRCRPGSVTEDVLAEFHFFSDSLDAFSFLVIQTGIGDCCPRPYPLWMNKLFLFLWGRPFVNKLNKWYPFLLKLRSRTWITAKQFGDYLDQMVGIALERNPEIKVALIAIGEPTRRLLDVVGPDSVRHQREFNQVMKSVAEAPRNGGRVAYIDPYQGVPATEIFIDDGHHPSVKGHELVSAALIDLWKKHGR